MDRIEGGSTARAASWNDDEYDKPLPGAAQKTAAKGVALILITPPRGSSHETSYTILFIQNLARWSATPPALLAHLLKQPVVRMNVGLKKMLLKHPNTPSEIKRGM